jgi:tetratricopeptide (TPR) repeat protein
MKLNFSRTVFAVIATLLLAASGIVRAETNAPALLTREDLQSNLLQVQAQIHSSQIAIEQAQQATLESARSNADLLNARIRALEQSIAEERSASANDRNAATEIARRSQQTMMFIAGGFGLAGLGMVCFMVYFLWRAFSRISEVNAQQHALIAQSGTVHQLAAPGRAAVESANAHLHDVVGRLERRILELEGGPKMLSATQGNSISAPDLLAEGQAQLDTGNATAALESFEKFLAANPNHAEAHVKRAAALEKLGRDEEALACCNRAIQANASLVTAHLHKGGLLNRLRRYDEALNCYEQALLVQEKKGK